MNSVLLFTYGKGHYCGSYLPNRKCECSVMVQLIPVDLCKLTFNPLVRAEQDFKVWRNEMESQRILMLWSPFL